MIFYLYAKYNYAENQYTISNFSVHETKSLTTSKGYKFSISQSIEIGRIIWEIMVNQKLFFM